MQKSAPAVVLTVVVVLLVAAIGVAIYMFGGDVIAGIHGRGGHGG
jgi:hypothetical protein